MPEHPPHPPAELPSRSPRWMFALERLTGPTVRWPLLAGSVVLWLGE